MQKATKEALTFCFFYIQSTTNTTIFIAIVQIILQNQQYFNKFGNNITIHPSRVAIYLIDYLNFQPETLRNASGFFFCPIIFHPQTSRNGKTIPKKHPRSRKRLPPCFLYVARSSDGCPLPWSFLPLPELTAGKRQQRERNHNQRRTHQAKSELHAFQNPECTPLSPFWLI